MMDNLLSLLPVNSNCSTILWKAGLGEIHIHFFQVVGDQKQTPQDPPQDFESGNTVFGFKRVGDHLSLLSCVRILVLVNHPRAPHIAIYNRMSRMGFEHCLLVYFSYQPVIERNPIRDQVV